MTNNTGNALQNAVDHLYDKVLQVANHFLHNAKTCKISILQLENPTYDAVASQMLRVAGMIELLCDELGDPLTGQKAVEYCKLMQEMAEAITANDPDRLQTAVGILDRRPFL
ncbi:hypothetical protein ACEUAC_07830 [Aeromonas veronii]|uniref:hypothetical protein n=1 Tax=Aeromonas veronii TaxID=654 RepID=UPI001D0A357D|nr:hypothetical protein [Aeromonas veronii]MCC0088176.1 hypothetical protein [Aeromonas veronii]